MTDRDYDFFEPWVTPCDLLPSFQHDHTRFYVPFTVYAETVEDAETAAMIHLGVTLTERGLRCSWLKAAGT